MGRSLARAALSHGDQVTVVGWTQENTMEQMEKWQDRNCMGLLCDVRVRETVESVIQRSIDKWGNVDIIAKYAITPFHQMNVALANFSTLNLVVRDMVLLPFLFPRPIHS